MRHNSPKLQTLEAPHRPLRLDQLAFLKEDSSRVDDIGTLLDQTNVILLIIDTIPGALMA